MLIMSILLIIIILCQGTTTIVFSQYPSQDYSSCHCEKGERGEKGDMGICPIDYYQRYNIYSKYCLNTKMNLKHLAQSIRQLIIDTKIVYRNARRKTCVCPTVPSMHKVLDYTMPFRMKGDKGDTGLSCSSNCFQSVQSNVRVFATVQAALDAAYTYPDHTYIHIVNERGHLQSVLIRVQERLIPLKLGIEHTMPVPDQTIAIPKPKCLVTLPCSRLHMFALGPYIRKMCHPKHPNVVCSKLSDYDNLCGRISQHHRLKGFYRAFMSSSTQWLANLFDGVCMNAKIINMHEQTLFDTFEDIFEQKPPQSEILDVKGLTPQFQYWWHGSLSNGTASSDTCLDWSRQDSNLSGIASRISDGINGLFHYQYLWPCSLSDSNMGILCIETNCNERNSYKH